jgi:endonuclease G
MHNIHRLHLFAAMLCAASITASAKELAAKGVDFRACPQFFANGIPPRIPNAPFWMPRALCYDAFAVLHSGTTKTPLFVAERLHRTDPEATERAKRVNRIFTDARLPRAERARLEDYKHSGFSPGRLAPTADMGTRRAIAQSFSLANIVPQAPQNSQKAWAEIEMATRQYAMRAVGDIFVVSGTVFESGSQTIGPGKVRVPQYLYKLVYDPASGRAWAHWLENVEDARVGPPISYSELVERTGTQFLTGLKVQ